MKTNSTELRDRRNLLLPNGALSGEGWARSEMFVFSRASVPLVKRLVRLKEWCSVCFGNDEVHLTLSVVDAGPVGLILADYVNIKTETVYSTHRYIPFTFGSLELPSNPDSGDVIVRAKEVSFDVLNSSTGLIVRCQFNAFDDVRPLYVNATLTDPSLEGAYTAQAVGSGFSYEHSRVYSHASGTVHFGADETKLDGGFGWTDRRRCVLPYTSQRSAIIINGTTQDGQPVALSLGGGYAHPTSPVRCRASVGGEHIKLGRVNISEERRGCRITSADKHLDLRFTAHADCPHRFGIRGLLELDRTTRFGECSGTARLGEHHVVLDGAFAAYSSETGRW